MVQVGNIQMPAWKPKVGMQLVTQGSCTFTCMAMSAFESDALQMVQWTRKPGEGLETTSEQSEMMEILRTAEQTGKMTQWGSTPTLSELGSLCSFSIMFTNKQSHLYLCACYSGRRRRPVPAYRPAGWYSGSHGVERSAASPGGGLGALWGHRQRPCWMKGARWTSGMWKIQQHPEQFCTNKNCLDKNVNCSVFGEQLFFFNSYPLTVRIWRSLCVFAVMSCENLWTTFDISYL